MAKPKKEDFNQIAYQNEYNRERYDRFSLMLPKGRKAELKAIADQKGMSLNELINSILTEALDKLGV